MSEEKRKAGRPPKFGETKIHVTFGVMPSDWAKIKEIAKEKNITLSKLLVDRALGREV